MKLASEVLVEDEALRDGLQNEQCEFTVAQKLRFVEALVDAGVRRIQVGSFVHPKRVPQMANTGEVFSALPTRPNVTYTALILNMAGLERALAARVKHLSISVSASETHSRKNANRSVMQAVEGIKSVVSQALANGVVVRGGIQCALGCGYEGAIPLARVCDIAAIYSDLGVQEINIADTAGLGNPRQVFETVEAVRARVRPDVKFSPCTCTTRAASASPTCWPASRRGWRSTTRRSGASAAARSFLTPPAISPRKTRCSRSRKWA